MNNENKISEEILPVYPNEIDTRNPKFIKFDEKYVSSLIVIGYNKEMEETFLDRILSQDINLQLSIFYEKQNTAEVIKKITYHIGNTGSEIKNSNENQSDSELMCEAYNDGKYIRRQLQLNGEELYYLYIYQHSQNLIPLYLFDHLHIS